MILLLQVLPESSELELILLDVSLVLLLIVIILFLILLLWRLYLIRKHRIETRLKSEIEELLLSYLDEDVELEELNRYLQSNLYRTEILINLALDLIQDLDGELKLKIRQVLSLNLVVNVYTRKFDNGNRGEVIDALKYYRYYSDVAEPELDKIQSLVNHKDEELSFAAAVALVNHDDIEIQHQTLKKACINPDLSRLSLLELLMSFSETNEPDFEKRGQLILDLINSNKVLLKFKYVLIYCMGEIGHRQQSPDLFQMLEAEVNKNESDEILVGYLIEALGKLSYSDMIPILKKIMEGNNRIRKLSAVKAIGAIGNKQCIQILVELSEDSAPEIKYEAMQQMLKIGEPVLEQIPKGAFNQFSSYKKKTLLEINETKALQYG